MDKIALLTSIITTTIMIFGYLINEIIVLKQKLNISHNNFDFLEKKYKQTKEELENLEQLKGDK